MCFENFNNIPPPPPEDEVLDIPNYSLKERGVKDPEELSACEYSKENLGAERTQLAAEILERRKVERQRVAELRHKIDELKKSSDQTIRGQESSQAELDGLETQKIERTNSLAGKFKSFVGIETNKDRTLQGSIEEKHSQVELSMVEKTAIAAELEGVMNELIDIDTTLKSLRGKIVGHYDEVLDTLHRSVEQTMIRNQAFFVHTINEWDELRHNDNSNVSKEASYEDDLDILLALEPSISASTVLSGADEKGQVSGLWSHTGGVLLSGGQVSEAYRSDGGTRSVGIKHRTGKYSDAIEASAKTLDDAIVDHRYTQPGDLGGYNEIVVNNPEVAGYFKSGEVDEDGIFWAFNIKMKESYWRMYNAYQKNPGGYDYSLERIDFHRNLDKYRERFNLVKGKGLPFYVMTPDRHFFEVLNVNDNGTLEVGDELTPEQAAKGKAGLPAEQRKEIGHKILQKEVFRDGKTQQEALNIIDEL